jgi:hypothetical protein
MKYRFKYAVIAGGYYYSLKPVCNIYKWFNISRKIKLTKEE